MLVMSGAAFLLALASSLTLVRHVALALCFLPLLYQMGITIPNSWGFGGFSDFICARA